MSALFPAVVLQGAGIGGVLLFILLPSSMQTDGIASDAEFGGEADGQADEAKLICLGGFLLPGQGLSFQAERGQEGNAFSADLNTNGN